MQEITSSDRDDDSYMYGKLLAFLRVSSLAPEFLIQCPDQTRIFWHIVFLNIPALRRVRTRVPYQNQNQNQHHQNQTCHVPKIWSARARDHPQIECVQPVLYHCTYTCSRSLVQYSTYCSTTVPVVVRVRIEQLNPNSYGISVLISHSCTAYAYA